jgi:class 3 adenylate cyclase
VDDGRGALTAAAPSGVVTFLFTDIEGSTRRWEADAEAMRAALLKHDDVLRTAIEEHEGFLFSHTGDGVVAAFASPRSAVDAAVAAQRALELPVRMGWRPVRQSYGTAQTARPTPRLVGDGGLRFHIE